MVDIQGKLSSIVHNSETMFKSVEKLIKGCSLLELPILVLEQNPERLGKTASQLTPLLSAYPFITKYTFSGCAEPRFVAQVEQANVENWLVCGIEAHVCVYQTAADLKAMGKSVELVTDCIASRSEVNKQLAITKLQALGLGITSSEMCLFELMEDCRDPKFRALLDIVR